MSSAPAVRNVQRSGAVGTLGGIAARLGANAWIWSAGSQALTSGFSLVTSIIAARMLGVERFGDYVLIQAVVMVLSGLQYQMIASPMAIIAGERPRSRVYFGIVASAVLSMALVIGSVAAAYGLILDRPGGYAFLALANFLFASGTVVQDGAKRILFASGRPLAAFLCELVRQVLFFLLLAVTWWRFGASTETLLVCAGLSMMLAGGPLLVPLLRFVRSGGMVRAVFFRHWQLGRWLMLMVLVSMAHEQLATIFAGVWIGEEAAAGLRAAHVLLGPLLVFMASLENVVPRRAAGQFRSDGEGALSRYLVRVALLSLLPVLAVCLGVILYGRQALGLLFGPGFAGFAPVAAIIAMCPPLQLIRELGMTYLRATGRTYGIFLAFVASAIATLAVIYPLMKAYGATGAAIAIVVGHSVSTLFVLGAVWKARGAVRAL